MVSTNTVQVPLTKGMFATVDGDDLWLVWAVSWKAIQPAKNCSYYAYNWSAGYMHRLILDAPRHLVVDHCDGNGLNNSRSNIRLATNQQNQWNRIAARKTGRLKGVAFCRGSWVATITIDGKQVHIGTFGTQEAAGLAYDRLALEHFGEFARLNFPGEAAQ